jgi:dolichyl-phosphate beta-glucosyltransferase
VELSIVIPAYDEESRLGLTLDGWCAFLDANPMDAEIIVSDDGSRDGTAALVIRRAETDGRIRLHQLTQNQGKGGAVREGMLAARGSYRFYVDADLNIAPDHVLPALELLKTRADLVVGKRSLTEYAAEEKSVARLVAGALVQITRRLFVLPVISDTQCGFKGFRADLAERVFAATLIRSFAFDVEALFLARRAKARIVALPVAVTFRDESTYSLRKHLPRFLCDILRIRVNALRGRYRRVSW